MTPTTLSELGVIHEIKNSSIDQVTVGLSGAMALRPKSVFSCSKVVVFPALSTPSSTMRLSCECQGAVSPHEPMGKGSDIDRKGLMVMVMVMVMVMMMMMMMETTSLHLHCFSVS